MPVPYRVPILGAVGVPISVPKAEGEPTQKDIDAYHAKLVADEAALFDDTKVLYGWQGKSFIIR